MGRKESNQTNKNISTGSTPEDRPCLTERLLMGRKESNQTKTKQIWHGICGCHDPPSNNIEVEDSV